MASDKTNDADTGPEAPVTASEASMSETGAAPAPPEPATEAPPVAPTEGAVPTDAPAEAGLGATDAGADAGIFDPNLADLEPEPSITEIVFDRVIDFLETGGPVVWILLVMSVFALSITLVKLWQFQAARVGDRRTPRRGLDLYRTGNVAGALGTLSHSRSPVSQALGLAIRGVQRGLPEMRVREEIIRYGGDALHTLRSLFRPLEVIATLAPLLGLLGTVMGMIEAFQQMAAAGNRVDPSILSGGIWAALLTTAVGLAVAIPVLAILNWLEGRVDRVAHDLDNVVTQVFTEDLSESSEVHDQTFVEPADHRRHAAAIAAGE